MKHGRQQSLQEAALEPEAASESRKNAYLGSLWVPPQAVAKDCTLDIPAALQAPIYAAVNSHSESREIMLAAIAMFDKRLVEYPTWGYEHMGDE